MTTVAQLFDTYRVDQAHARQVADLALGLFDAVAKPYGLPVPARRLVEIGSLLHNVGLTTDPPAHHLVGRDIVLRHLLDDCSQREQALIACIVAFHRKKVRPATEPAYLSLGKKNRQLALQLAAIVRVADGLDYHQSQTTQLQAVSYDDNGMTLHLSGPYAAADGERAVAKADLWQRVFDQALRIEVGSGEAGPIDAEQTVDDTPDGPMLQPWYAESTALLAELGRVLLRRHFRRMLQAERDVRADREIEAVHALRVATRRLRATLKLLAPVAPAAEVRRFSKAVQRVAQVAGAVRDRDVLLVHLDAVMLPDAAQQAELAEVRAGVAAARSTAHARLIARLDSAEHEQFKHAFANLMGSTAGWDNSVRVRDVAGSILWRHYEALRAHDRDGLPSDIAEIHAMRIEGKRLRYVLELFTDTFGERVNQVVNPLVAFQDHLGALNDAEVAAHILTSDAPAGTADTVAAYMALREAEATALLGELSARWDKVASATYRRRLMELIVKL
jgi:CHAD domain-containing protein